MSLDLKSSVLLKTLEPLRPYFLSAGFFSLFINILMIVPAIYMLQLYDRALTSQSISTLLMLTLIMVFLLASLGGLDWVRTQIMARAGARLEEILADRVFTDSFRQFLQTTGRSSTQPLADLSGLRGFIAGTGINAIFDSPWVIIYIIIMYLFHAWFGNLAVFSVLLLGALSYLNHRFTQGATGEAAKEQVWTRVYAERHLRNAEVLESMGMMADIRNRWSQHNQRVIALQVEASNSSSVFGSSSKSLRLMLQSLALGLGAYLAIKQEISPGMMIAGSILLGRALAPVDQLVNVAKSFPVIKQQFERLEELLSAFPPEQPRMALPAPEGLVSVEEIRVAPPGVQMLVLKGVSFQMEPGNSLGIIGPSGSGKSTLARALLGVWPAVMGVVRLDGADIAKWDREQLGPYLGYLPQDIELFDGTISENIARFGDIDPEQIVEAARMAGVHDMILRLPEGYDTVIGASGGALSAGQRQRIALARALYRNPRLVVLDEPNSNLDDLGEAALRGALQRLKQVGTTTVVITHRPNILASIDRILVLRDGQVADLGPTDLIMRKYTSSNLRPAALPQRGGPQTPEAS